MAQSSDPKLVEFLTSDRNVRCVLEVLRHGEAIRARLTERFWSGLKTHMKNAARTNAAKKLKWEAGSWAKGKEAWVRLDAQISQFKDSPQNLSFSIEYYTSPDGLDLYYGLRWKKETRPSSKLFSAKHVLNLRRLLEREDYELTDQECWCGWKYVRRFSGPDDFLSFFVENRNVLFQSVSDGFWPFVEHTISHVGKVNRSLKAKQAR